jgi:putative peptidoglycan lipid II flippase
MAAAVRLLSRVDLPDTLFVVVGIAVGAAVYAGVYLALGGRELLTLLQRKPERAAA